MTPREIIISLEKKGLKRLKGVRGNRADKIRVVRCEIARSCKVGVRTVNNWRADGPIGPQSKELLEVLAAREGVL